MRTPRTEVVPEDERRTRRPPAVTEGPPDADLVARLDAGDPYAMRPLYERYARPAYSLARRICCDQGLAEDVVQEVFLMLWCQPSRYIPARGSFRTWLLTVIHHKAVDVVRREHAACRRTIPSTADGEDWAAPLGPGADEAALQSVLAGQVQAALHQLPFEQRRILLLAYYGGYTHTEISKLAKVPLGTVKSRMLLGVRRLRILLRPLLEAHPAA